MTHAEKKVLAKEKRAGAKAILGIPFPTAEESRGPTGRRRARRYARKIARAFRKEILSRASMEGNT
jgi:hypothetical protein